jgi:hypothetical protein
MVSEGDGFPHSADGLGCLSHTKAKAMRPRMARNGKCVERGESG